MRYIIGVVLFLVVLMGFDPGAFVLLLFASLIIGGLYFVFTRLMGYKRESLSNSSEGS